MKPLELRLTQKLLKKVLGRPCPTSVPRSGVAGAKMNCFCVYVDKAGDPYLLVSGISDNTLGCLEWTGSTFDKPVDIELRDLDPSDFSVTHFYGHNEVQYKGITRLFLARTLFLPYVKIHLVRAFESTDQYFFNKKKLLTKQRIELLRLLVARRLEGRSISSPVELMTELYSVKWVWHPDRDSQQKRVRFYLDSLVDTGELRRTSDGYELTGKALEAIEVYEEQERKHTESVKIQRGMLWLTLAIVLLTAAQAGLYKLPTLLDFSGWTMRPNPSIERDVQGLSPSAAPHVKRWAAQE